MPVPSSAGNQKCYTGIKVGHREKVSEAIFERSAAWQVLSFSHIFKQSLLCSPLWDEYMLIIGNLTKREMQGGRSSMIQRGSLLTNWYFPPVFLLCLLETGLSSHRMFSLDARLGRYNPGLWKCTLTNETMHSWSDPSTLEPSSEPDSKCCSTI